MPDQVALERSSGIALAYLNRPQRLNALDLETVLALKNTLQQLAIDDTVSAVVISGKGKAFCAGGDLAWATGLPDGARSALHGLVAEFHQAILEIREMRKPVIAAVNGVAAGGGLSLCMACDFRVLSHQATLRHAYGSAGLSMDGGLSFMLPRMVGSARALEIAAFDTPIPADRALSLGLATEVTGKDAVDAALAMAKRLSERALGSFAWSKQLLSVSSHSALEAQLALERQGMVECVGGPEGKEGVSAFVEKRRPDFAGARTGSPGNS